MMTLVGIKFSSTVQRFNSSTSDPEKKSRSNRSTGSTGPSVPTVQIVKIVQAVIRKQNDSSLTSSRKTLSAGCSKDLRCKAREVRRAEAYASVR
jgi:hypothetical protein